MYRSAARGLGCRRFRTRLCTALAVIRSHAKRGAGMWNLTSLRAARACRKLGRVASLAARQVHSIRDHVPITKSLSEDMGVPTVAE